MTEMTATGGLLGTVLPAGVRWRETRDDHDDLFDAERAVVTRAVAKRRAEFATVRWCARAALATLGVPPAPIVPGERGAPGWPEGIVGSMTHCLGYRAAAVARRAEVTALGIDAEPADVLPEGVLGAIALPSEAGMIARLTAADPTVFWDRLLFSAKESVYKAWFPTAGVFLNFHEAELTLDPAGTFAATVLVPGPFAGFEGRWTQASGIVLTAITVV